MFTEKLNLIIRELGATDSELAELAGFDRTNLSHFRHGRRTPSASGTTGKKLISALYLCAKKHDKSEVLCRLTEAEPSLPQKKMEAAISKWLYDDIPQAREDAPDAYQGKAPVFCERLDIAMKLAELSNIQLSRMIHTDASLISRYRSGERRPRVTSSIIPLLSETLWQQIEKNNNTGRLAKIIDHSSGQTDKEAFSKWLFDSTSFHEKNTSVAKRFLELFEHYQAEAEPDLPSYETVVTEEELNDINEMYLGTNGLQTAVIRFLGNVIRSGKKELWLYSDQNMDWMILDEDFRFRWSVLMSECVKRKIKIRIIHNIDRNLREMFDAVQSWLPLYMSGMIEPYYLKKAKDNRFSNTVLLCPGLSCVQATHVIGTETAGLYNYYTDKFRLFYYKNAYKKLLEQANPLITFDAPEPSNAVSEFSLGNIDIRLTDTYVNIAPKEHADISFNFMHPLLIQAFTAYLTLS